MQQKMKPTPIVSDQMALIANIRHIPEFLEFARWCATPWQFRKPASQKEFGEQVGVCEDTLTDWKRHPQFWPLVQQYLGEWIKERIPDVVGGLYEKAAGKGHAKDVEMFLRLAGIETKPKNK